MAMAMVAAAPAVPQNLELQVVPVPSRSRSQESTPATTPAKIHVEKVQGFNDIMSEGYSLAERMILFNAPTKKYLPEPLKGRPTLTGEQMTCFRGTRSDRPQFISKTSQSLKNISPSVFYVKYYAYLEGDEGRNSRTGALKTVFVRPALAPDDEEERFKYLAITQDYQWREEIVELDMDMATEEHPKFNGFEFGIRNFERGDFLVLNRFVILQGVPSPGLDRLRAEFDDPISLELNEAQGTHEVPKKSNKVIACISSFCLQPFLWCWNRCGCCFNRRGNDYEGF